MSILVAGVAQAQDFDFECAPPPAINADYGEWYEFEVAGLIYNSAAIRYRNADYPNELVLDLETSGNILSIPEPNRSFIAMSGRSVRVYVRNSSGEEIFSLETILVIPN